MKHLLIKTFNAVCTLLLTVTLLMSCSSDNDTIMYESLTNTSTSEHHLNMVFHGSVAQFDVTQTRTEGNEWDWLDGSTVYIQFHTNGGDVVKGYATYSKSSYTWDASYSGTLAKEGTCELYFFDGAPTSDRHNVTLNGSNAVYTDMTGTYLIEENCLIVNAMLKPHTSRIRFKGNTSVGIDLLGVSYYTGYNIDENKFTNAIDWVNLKVGNEGYTPYLYCVFADVKKPTLSIKNSVDGDGIIFQKTFDSSVLNVGESGYMTIPTEEKNWGWNVIIPITSLTLNKTSVTLDKGEKVTLVANITPTDATDTSLTWKSSNTSVATVSNGVVTAVNQGSATITAMSVADNSKKAECQITVVNYKNGHDYVDLGLTSGLLWATCNVGATSPSEYGSKFAWGETSAKASYTESNYTYKGTPSVLPLEQDAARANWGGYWRMPTKSEFIELCNECDWVWISIDGKYGYKISSKTNGNSIFLPACFNSSYYGTIGCYWSSSSNNNAHYAYYLFYSSTYIDNDRQIERYEGNSVRPVLKK